MNNKTLSILATIVGCGVALLLLINTRDFLTREPPKKYITQDDVRGMAILHKKKLYTLNFDQQKEAIHLLNLATASSQIQGTISKETPDFSKIVIYVFDGDPIEIIPLAWEDHALVFSAPLWHRDGYLRDTSNGKLYDLLKNTYDP